MKSRLTPFLIAALLIGVSVAAAVYASEWPMYRHDQTRTGMADEDALTGSRPVPIWVFPYPEPEVEALDNDVLSNTGVLVNDRDGFAIVSGSWFGVDSSKAPNAYQGDAIYAVAGADARVQWDFPLEEQKAQLVGYYVKVWYPSQSSSDQYPVPGGPPRTQTTRAYYAVQIVNDSGSVASQSRYAVDQTSGGNWETLTSSPVLVRDDQYIRVILTTEGADEYSVVVADGVTLVQDLGHVISSPAFAPGGSDAKDDLVISLLTENRPLPTVTVREPATDSNGNNVFGEDGKPIFTNKVVQNGKYPVRVGVVYGIAAEDSPDTGGLDERGIPKWWFPYDSANWIAEGFSSSPLVGAYNGEEVAYCPAKDGQVYVVRTGPVADESTGRLVWQGPGYLAEPTAPAAWTAGTHDGYQGAGYLQAKSIADGDSGETKATWDFDIGRKGEYSAYAWIPPSTQAEASISDAAYTVTVGNKAAVTATVDQANGGRWVLLGTYEISAANTSVKIELSNKSKILDWDDDSSGTRERYVVADAIKIVPSDLGMFDMASPAISADGARMYIGSTTPETISGSIGRVYCYEIGKPDPVWVYPDPNDSDKDKTAAVGGFEASPTLNEDGSRLYIGCKDGHVYCLDTSNGSEKWVYPSKDPDDGPLAELGKITSTIALDDTRKILYVPIGSDRDVVTPPTDIGPDSAGRIIALRDNSGSAALLSTYPDPDPDGDPNTDDGVEALGSFLWSSPLLYDDGNSANDVLVVGSSDGYLIGLDPATSKLTSKWINTDDGSPVVADLINEIYSSPAGVDVDAEGIPMAFVGTQGGFLWGVDLRTGRKHWSYGLKGAVASSPALAQERLYVGDTSGLTWAFSTRPGSGSDGYEDWNEDIGGPEISPRQNSGKQSQVEVDLFTQAEYNKIKDGAKVADGDLHKLARAQTDYNPGPQPGHSHHYPYPYEWGETVYLIAWNCFDPNDPEVGDEETKWPGPDPKNRGTSYKAETDSVLRVTVKSRGPGDQSDQSSAFTMSEKGAVWDDKNDRPVYFAKYAYVLGTSSSSSTQAPGTSITATVQELPSTKSDSPNSGSTTGDCAVPEHSTKSPILPELPNPDPDKPGMIYDHTKFKPQRISINNPLALAYTDPITTRNWLIAVESLGTEFQTHRYKNSGHNLVSHNGNRRHVMPWVRTGLVAHGTNSDEYRITAIDRSLLRLTGNRLSKFRVERSDLRWRGGDGRIWNGSQLPWEELPAAVGPNTSLDYPDIRGRQINFAMAESRIDPTIEETTLRPGPVLAAIPTSDQKWQVGRSPVGETIAVPRFQPANMPSSWPTKDETLLETSGYSGRVYTFIDSNGDGRLSLPGQSGSNRIVQQSVTGGRTEAYREFNTQAHVPPDYRVEVAEKTFDIGAVPHAFGLTTRNSAQPTMFGQTLGENAVLEMPMTAPGKPVTTPGYFDPWFKSFTAYNQGNVNMLNIQVSRLVNSRSGDQYSLDLFSDTAEGGMYRASAHQLRPYGAYLPQSNIVTALDPKFMNPVPQNFPSITGNPDRSFHKPRVGEQPTVLRIPDMPKRLYDTYSAPSLPPDAHDIIPPLPFLSVAVPIGTPVGTYSQKLTLYEDANRNGWYDPRESVGDPLMEVKVTVTENRLTDGYMPGALQQVDPNEVRLPNGQLAPNVPQPRQTGDVAPAAYIGPDGSLHLFWSSSRYGTEATGTAGDRWLISKSSLLRDSGFWNLAPSGNYRQWWSPAAPYPGINDASIASFFDVDSAGNNKPGDVLRNSVKFTSPSIARDPINPAATWLFFGGEAVRSIGAGTVSATKAHEFRTYYVPLDAEGNPSGDAVSTTRDWTMPKYGVRGVASGAGSDLSLWTFWYGGNNNEWSIFYNMSPVSGTNVGEPDSWSNDSRLSVPRGLVSAAEPTIMPRIGYDKNGNPHHLLDVVYSAYSQYHKNADIYLSRYRPDDFNASTGVMDLDIRSLPRVRDEVLVRDPASAIYSSRHVDWEPDADEFVVTYQPDAASTAITVISDENFAYSRDPQTRALIFTYTGNQPNESNLKSLFRSVVIDPAAGTVKFLRDPGPKAIIRATYRPRAYRLTTDGAADTSPCALLDNGANVRYNVAPLNFWLPSNYDSTPTVDRLWVLWRRPSTAMKGTGIFYKSMRYTAVLTDQIATNAAEDIEWQSVGSGSPGEPSGPVEVDWAKKRLYFTSVDEGREFSITYPNAAGTTSEQIVTVELSDELDAYGHSFGNLTSEVANEGQICAIKDPNSTLSKLWVFWTSSRAGNTDVYYEAICPRFYSREFK